MSIKNGTLYVVATPIGNLDDITLRAKTVLQDVDLILAEDTRHSQFMLQNFGIKKKIFSYHDHNEHRQTDLAIQQLQQGLDVALIADAGTPLICDPGYHLLVAAHQLKITVVPIPGASAVISALSVAGFCVSKFVFEGFLPAQKTQRKKHLDTLYNETRTLVFYESPHRIVASVEALMDCFGGERQAVIAKELTKLHESICRGSLTELLLWLQSKNSLTKGEFVLVVCGNNESSFDLHEARRVLQILLANHSVKEASRLASDIMRGNRNRIYKLAMELAK